MREVEWQIHASGFSFPALGQELPPQTSQLVLSGDATPESGALAVSIGSHIFLYDLASPDAQPQVFEMSENDGYIGLSPGGEYLSLPVSCNLVTVIATETGQEVARLETDDPYCLPLRLAFSPDGGYAFLSDGRLFTLDTLLADQLVTYTLSSAMPSQIAFSADSRFLLYPSTSSSEVLIYDIAGGEQIESIQPATHYESYSRYREFVISQDRQLIGGLVNSGPTNILKLETGDLIQRYWQDTENSSVTVWLEGVDGQVRSVHRGAGGGVPTYWRIYSDFEQTLDDVSPIELETKNVTLGTFSPDGSLLVLVTQDNTIALHDGTDGTFLRTLPGPQQRS